MRNDTDWKAMGIVWLEEKVSKRPDGNTKVEVHGTAQIPQVVDVSAAFEHFGNDAIAGALNGTSWRVAAQDVNRRMLPSKATVDAIREAVYMRLKGIRNAAIGDTKTIYKLPDGTSYTGSDLVEYRQAFVAALVDLGVDPTAAIAKSESITL